MTVTSWLAKMPRWVSDRCLYLAGRKYDYDKNVFFLPIPSLIAFGDFAAMTALRLLVWRKKAQGRKDHAFTALPVLFQSKADCHSSLTS